MEKEFKVFRFDYKFSKIPGLTYFRFFKCVWDLYHKVKKENKKPDLIHSNTLEINILAILIGKFFKIPVVISEHWSGILKKKLSLKLKMKIKFAFNNSLEVMPVSKTLANEISKLKIRSKLSIVPNVIDNQLFYPKKQKSKDSKKRILYVGSLISTKGLVFLLQAINSLSNKRHDFKLDVIGDDKEKGEYQVFVQKNDLINFVEFHGLKNKIEVAEYMRNCDFYVQPSLIETFGITFYEALACGKPVVATDIPALKENIDETKGILVPPEDTRSLEAAIDYMLDNFQNYNPEHLSQYVTNNFSKEVIKQKLYNVYKKYI